MKFETLAVHAGGSRDRTTFDVAPPIHLSTTFEHGPAAERPGGHIYIRESNPTQSQLGEALAAIEGGEAALVFASGLAAGAAYLQAMPPDRTCSSRTTSTTASGTWPTSFCRAGE